MMITTHEEEPGDLQSIRQGTLAFHVRRLRQWHGVVGLSQRDLAELAGSSAKQVQLYESTRFLPQPVEFVLAVAIALRVPVEWLVAPERMKQLRTQVEQRRAALQARNDGQVTMDLPRPGL